MADKGTPQMDTLLLLRKSIESDAVITPVIASDDTSKIISSDVSFARATHLQFSSTQRLLSLSTPTRFISSETSVDLRSIYFAWLRRDLAIPEYNAAVLALNTELGAGAEIHKLAFVERLDLITWLEGASEDIEYIKPLAEDSNSATTSVNATGAGIKGSSNGGSGNNLIKNSATGKQLKSIDPRLAQIYSGERKMGDRNSVLRGIKPSDFSHVRKLAAPFNSRKAAAAAAAAATATATQNSSALPHNSKTPTRRPDPIILLSPSASSLLKMSNIKSFLESGIYVPADGANSTSTSTASILHISRFLPNVDSSRPIRFIIVDTPEQFKPEYWGRVVAVFTTGQVWQFKSYKWQQPTDLFRHTLGVYVGWRGEPLPETVKGWGRGVLGVGIDKYVSGGSRWRDREIVESIWKGIEEGMRAKGWTRENGPLIEN
ncbi:Cell division control protein 73 [Erysiphe neolycopersici]|uniref:Cell division control protein 73 n=1 Tax=Erysiphe neolycopersici TaxID=212602 RepID=A0A420HUB6_9PEZI|nr:Cell division control protein 73 [Erysiphe neolycopersici]